MAEEIRGLSVKFDADFSEFKKNMRLAEKDIGSTQRQLKTLQDSLKMEWDPKKFIAAQDQAQKALSATEEKASILRKRLQEMEEAGVTDKTRDEYNYLSEQLNKTELNAQKLREQLKSLDNIRLSHLTANVDKVATKLNTASVATRGLSLAAGAAVVGLTASGLKTVEQADEIATLATQYKMTTDAIQRFNYVALQTDTQSEYLYKGFVKVQGGVADLRSGIESVSTKALAQLNLQFENFSGAEEQFYAIIDALSNMEDQTKMVSLANDIFGERMATNLFPLIYAGTDAVNEYRQEFEAMGALTEEQVLELAEFDNVLNDLKTQYKNVGLSLGTSLLPVMQTFSEVLVEDVLPILREVVAWYRELDDGQQKALLSALLFTAVLSPMLKLFSSVAKGISGLIKWLGEMDKATLASYAKWALLAASIGAVIAVIANWSKMNTVQRVIGLLGALTAAALSAAIAMGAFHSAWSVGAAAAGIVAGIVAVTAAVRSAEKESKGWSTPSVSSFYSSSSLPQYSVPDYNSQGSTVTNNQSSNYVDNSNVVINIEKNEYMSEEDIIKAVNKGLKQAKQTRT